MISYQCMICGGSPVVSAVNGTVRFRPLFRGRGCAATRLFFFRAEDGIRAATVTGVQTCALPIFGGFGLAPQHVGRTEAVGCPKDDEDRKSGVEGKRVELGGGSSMKTKTGGD